MNSYFAFGKYDVMNWMCLLLTCMGLSSILCGCSSIIFFTEIEQSPCLCFYSTYFSYSANEDDNKMRKNSHAYTWIAHSLSFDYNGHILWNEQVNKMIDFWLLSLLLLVLYSLFGFLMYRQTKNNEKCTVWFRIYSYYPAYDRLPENLYIGHWVTIHLMPLPKRRPRTKNSEEIQNSFQQK